jgi:hypothetical protein
VKNPETVGGVQSLVNAGNKDDLQAAAPHVAKLREWATKVLEPKVKVLKAGKNPGAVEEQLEKDLGGLQTTTTALLAAFDAAVKTPTAAALKTLVTRTNVWQTTLLAAYKKLEGEKDAFAVEELVKKEFDEQAKAKPKPKPKRKP